MKSSSAPARVQSPIYNRAVVVQNEMLVHRGEGNGPVERRRPDGLAFESVFTGDPADRGADGARRPRQERDLAQVAGQRLQALAAGDGPQLARRSFAELADLRQQRRRDVAARQPGELHLQAARDLARVDRRRQRRGGHLGQQPVDVLEVAMHRSGRKVRRIKVVRALAQPAHRVLERVDQPLDRRGRRVDLVRDSGHQHTQGRHALGV